MLTLASKRVRTAVACLLMMSVLVTSAYADDIENDIAYTSPETTYVTPVQEDSSQQNQQGTQASKPQVDYAGDLFGDVKLDKNNSYAEPINGVVRTVVNTVTTFCINFLPMWIVASFMIDILCISAPPVMWFFANMVPLQVFSPEVSQITGIQFAGQTGGQTTSADMGNKNKYVWYCQERVISSVFALFIVVLVSSGVYFKLTNWIINIIVNGIVNIIPA